MTKKKSSGRARSRGAAILLNVEIEPALDAALEACRQQERRTKKAVVSLAIERYLADAGFWPPKEKPG